MTVPRTLAIVLFAVMSKTVACQAPLTGDVTNIHDPSGIVFAEDQRPMIFSTSHNGSSGIFVHSASTDLRQWEFLGFVWTVEPTWIAKRVPENSGQGVWAPDIHRRDGVFHLYYTISSFGSMHSCIGYATTARLLSSNTTWSDHGPVLCSGEPGSAQGYNALDPHVAVESNGNVWMSVGSFFSGIQIFELDPKTGFPKTPSSAIAIAARPNTSPPSIEASWLHYVQSTQHFYLFVNFGMCCRGITSTYNIRVGRSSNITGPYLDQSETSMLLGGGTLVQGINDGDRVVGPGQVGITLLDNGVKVVTEHFYDRKSDPSGVPTLNLLELTFDPKGWPLFSAFIF